MIDERLKVTDDILASLRQMNDAAVGPSQMIWFLYNQGVPKAGAIIALRHAGVMPVEETKQAVHLHEAYEDRRASDEAFDEAVANALASVDKEAPVAA